MIQKGSIVVIKRLPIFYKQGEPFAKITWLPQDDELTHYIVREAHADPLSGVPIVFLEEGIVGYFVLHNVEEEIGIVEDFVVELMPPEALDIEELMEDSLYVKV